MKKVNKRVLCAVLAAVLALSMIVSGVYAWIDNSQHKSNVATGGNENKKQDVVLVEDYEEPDDWQQDDELKKEVWVKNTGEGNVFVRLQLKEYMDISKITYSYSDEYLLMDSDGKFVASAGGTATDPPTKAQRDAFKLALDNMVDINGDKINLVFDDSQIKPFKAYGDVWRFYLVTDKTTNINGKYGKRLLEDFDQATPRSLVAGVERGEYEETIDHKLHPTSECLYTPHTWLEPPAGPENCGHGDDGETPPRGFHDYVEWTLGQAAQLIKLSDWDGRPVAAWILDDSSPEGWAYWGQALEPGNETAKLLESIKLIKQPDGPFYYAIHVDMQTADLYQLKANFDDMPKEIEDALRDKLFTISGTPSVGVRGSDVVFTAMYDGKPVPVAEVNWLPPAAASGPALGPNTKFIATGVLRIGGGQSSATVILVTGKYTPADGIERTATFTVTIAA
ncbi:MAG: hypothetical protein LBB50_03780 [Oscillospiraceae bacterium]|jgi:hypothetical protein|nr:hypothetical protein [Oscillospiraceae bacterium]